jgi:hypothetical protein
MRLAGPSIVKSQVLFAKPRTVHVPTMARAINIHKGIILYG